MKRYVYALFGLLLTPLFAGGQNLVPNWSFEDGACPVYHSELATAWERPINHYGSPDYFKTCGTPVCGVPRNFSGYQLPATGDAYAGLFFWCKRVPSGSSTYREYLQTRLSAPLSDEYVYRVSVKCSYRDSSTWAGYTVNGPPITTDGLGIYLTSDPRNLLLSSGMGVIPMPQLYQPMITVTSSGWTEMAFDYSPQGGEQYLVIGNFKDDASTVILPRPAEAPDPDDRSAMFYYFYIDDISVQMTRRVSADKYICRGDSVDLVAPPGLGYTWVLANAQDSVIGIADSIRVSPAVTSVYYRYSNLDTVRVTVYVSEPLPPIEVQVVNRVPVCEGDSVWLGVEPPVPGSQFTWEDGSFGPNHKVGRTGLYYVRVDRGGCKAGDSLELTFNPLPVVDLGPDRGLCHGDSLLLDVTLPGATYFWQDYSYAPTFRVTAPGTYWVGVIRDGCRTGDTVRLSDAPVPVFDLGNDVALCAGEPVLLNAKIPNGTYSWQDNSAAPTFTPVQSGTYRVRVSLGNCSAVDSVAVLFYPLPTVNLGADTTLCTGDSLRLDATVAGLTYRWQDGGTGGSYVLTHAGTYVLEVTDANGCRNKDAVTVDFISPPRFDFPDSVLCYGDMWVLDITSDRAVYRWQDESVLPVFTVMHEGIYRAEAHNACGSAVDTVEIGYRHCNCRLFVPGSFTPEGNGINEHFMVWQNEECTLTQYEFTVFDRWGRAVFETRNIQQGWDGKIDGQTAPVDVYAYRVLYKFDKTPLRADRGSLVLLR